MRRDLAVCLLLVMASLAVYGQVVHHDFVNFDDDRYVSENLHVRGGLTWKAASWAFTTMWASNWHPLTWLSHMLDCELFGLNAGVHHLVNVLLHILNTVLLYLVFRRMTGAVWRSGIVAALFALHPLHVESVAWVAERKDVLSTLFFMLTLGAYARYAERPSRSRYGPVFGFLALGLMAKPMLVTVPFVLLLLDVWPLGRFHRAGQPGSEGTQGTSRKGEDDPRRTSLQLIAEKVPLFALVAASSVVTFVAQQRGGAMAFAHRIPFSDRVASALVSYVVYMGKMLWPSHLAVFYPYRDALPTLQWVGAAVLLTGISVLVARGSRRWRYLAVGWFWYLGTLVPVIGFVQVGAQSMADRYTYVPLIGLFLMAVWGLADLAAGRARARIGLAASAGVALLGFMGATWFQVSHWKSGTTLFEHALKVTENNAVAHNSLGVALKSAGRPDEAVYQYREALRIDPEQVKAHVNLGLVFTERGEPDQAIVHYREALRLAPEFAQAHNQLGIVLVQQGKLDEAITHYREAIRVSPEFARAYSNLGAALMTQGNLEEAITNYREALRLNPEFPQAYGNLGAALMAQGRLDEGLVHCREALRLNPEFAEAHVNLGIGLAQQGNQEEAVLHLQEAIRINPNYARAQSLLDILAAAQGRENQAVAPDPEAIRSAQEDARAYHGMGIQLARQGKLDDSIVYFRKAVRLDPGFSEYRSSLALALSGQGEFQEAMGHYQEAIRLNANDPAPYNNLAWIRATHPDSKLRNGPEAVLLAERANELSGHKNPGLLDTLAAAYAEAGRFPEAIATLKEAISLAASAGSQALAQELEQRLVRYEAKLPYREIQVLRKEGER